MNSDELQKWRVMRLKEAIRYKTGGNVTHFGKLLDYKDGSFVRQMLSEGPNRRKVSEETIEKIEALPGMQGWFTQPAAPTLDANQGQPSLFDYAGAPPAPRRVRVVGMAKLGENGWYEEISMVPGIGDGYVEVPTRDPDAYALVVRGDSMYPAIRDGWLVVVEPNERIAPGEYVMIKLNDGRKMVKELLYRRSDSLGVLSVNGEKRFSLLPEEVEAIHSVGPILPPSRWRPDLAQM